MPPSSASRVAYVLKMYPRLAETFILNEIVAHEAAGLDLEIFSLRSPIDGRFHPELARVRASVTYLPGQSVKSDEFWSTVCAARRELPGGRTIMDDAEMESSADLYQAILLARAALERNVEHLHAHFASIATTVARLASRLSGIPYSFTAHAKDIFHESVEDDDLGRKLREAAAVVTVSDFNVDYLRERFGKDAATVQRIYNGLDLNDFPFSMPDDRSPLILAVGRFVDKKGFGDLIAACALLAERGREFECEIIGDGVLRAKLLEQVKSLGVGDVVKLVGARSRDAVARRMSEAAVLAVPCVVSPNGNRDGLPTVLLEAMALGTPCISTDVTGIPELVRDGETGVVVSQRDPADLAAGLERLLDDRSLRVDLARRARAVIEAEFDIARNLPVQRELFRALNTPKTRVAMEVG